jgi:hypothetical protein
VTTEMKAALARQGSLWRGALKLKPRALDASVSLQSLCGSWGCYAMLRQASQLVGPCLHLLPQPSILLLAKAVRSPGPG